MIARIGKATLARMYKGIHPQAANWSTTERGSFDAQSSRKMTGKHIIVIEDIRHSICSVSNELERPCDAMNASKNHRGHPSGKISVCNLDTGQISRIKRGDFEVSWLEVNTYAQHCRKRCIGPGHGT